MGVQKAVVRVITLSLLLSLFVNLEVQLNQGASEGVVPDLRGAAVLDASVNVTAIEINEVQSSESNNSGHHRFEALTPLGYRVHLGASSFRPLGINGIDVPTCQVTRVDAASKAGRRVLEQAKATAAPPLLETSTSNSSTTRGANEIEQIPLAGGDLQQLTFLFSGVNSVAGPPGSHFGFGSRYGGFPDLTRAQGSNVSVNGGRGGANAWYL